MDTKSRFWSRLGGLGVVYAAMFVIAQALIGNGPGTGASGAAIVEYYRAHRASEIAGVFVVAVALVAFSFFLAALGRALRRSELGRGEEAGQMGMVVTIGGAVYIVGLLVMAVSSIALVDAAHYHLGGAAQTLTVFSNDLWVPVVTGLSVLALGTGVSVLRTGGLPRWLGWASVVLGVLALSGPAGAVAFLLAPVWAFVVGIVIMRTPFGIEAPAETSTNPYSLANS
jgi:hypothetical protein